jgi:uncharacterized membrane protein
MDISTLGEWFFCSVCMFSLPFVSYFGAQYIIQEHYKYLVEENYFLSVVIPVFAAVFTVWIIIAIYVYRAFREDANDRENEEEDDEEDEDDELKED